MEMYKISCKIIMIIITDKCICQEFEVINIIIKSPTTSASLAKKKTATITKLKKNFDVSTNFTLKH